MTKVLLSVHVLAAIVVIGPITVAASLFPRHARQAAASAAAPGEPGEGRDAWIAAFLHRICRGYAVAGIAVPVFGIATGAQLGVLTDAWLIASLVLTAIAAAVLVLAIVPGQRRMLRPAGGAGAHTAVDDAADDAADDGGARSAAARLSMLTGAFNLLWAVVVVLMIVRPGSTTGA
ncbi:hypothetical protein ACLIYM_14795 [Streptomyces fenghuangensis]|uniref:DUF2269 family protein n=1 Tax=Streptomyces chitinivorans TaxID=1257027 RepID=A0ABW7HQ29_9ACTN|nr:hypothetical protein [Streptomyces chitinivorans]MDH2410658.1 hypothetical protein [Streptomyces chitinivorans]